MSLPTVPDWLKVHDGALKPGINDRTVFVLIGGEPQYRLEAQPAVGKFVCDVIQTVNGRMTVDDTKYDTRDAALAGGLNRLRSQLGW
jgi:hypothetical protein